jgi:gluconate kinase
MSFHLSFNRALLDPTGPHWLDDASDVSCKDGTRQHSVDDPRLSCSSVPTRERPLVPEADDQVVLVFLAGDRRLG